MDGDKDGRNFFAGLEPAVWRRSGVDLPQENSDIHVNLVIHVIFVTKRSAFDVRGI